MANLGWRSLSRSVLVGFLLAAPCGRALAQQSIPVTPQALQDFRSSFNGLLDRYGTVFQATANGRGLRLVAAARLGLQAVSDSQLAAVFAPAGVPDLSEAISAADGLVAATPSIWPLAPTAPAPLSPGFPGAPPIFGPCQSIPHDSAFTFGALVAFQVARAVFAAADKVCEETVVVAGEGGNTSLACVPLEIAKDASAIPFELATFCGGEETSALIHGSFDRLDHIHADLDAARVAILADIDASTATIVSNDNANAAAIVANANADTATIVNNDNANRDQIIKELRALGCETVRLATTPQGRRASAILSCQGQPGYPYSWNGH